MKVQTVYDKCTDAVKSIYGISEPTLWSKSRIASLVDKRRAVAVLICELSNSTASLAYRHLSIPFDRTTFYAMDKKGREMLGVDKAFTSTYETIKKEVTKL